MEQVTWHKIGTVRRLSVKETRALHLEECERLATAKLRNHLWSRYAIAPAYRSDYLDRVAMRSSLRCQIAGIRAMRKSLSEGTA
jgi:hypothetical protein